MMPAVGEPIAPSPRVADLTVVILTRNEEQNLPHCLASLQGWVRHILVVDSLSTDETAAIARRAGAQVIAHSYENYPAQWLWIFQSVNISTAWILAIDADHRVSPALRDKILDTLPVTPPEIHGYYVDRQFVFRGRSIRWGGSTRPQLKLFRTDKAWCDERETPDIHFYVKGRAGHLEAPLYEDNKNEMDLRFWIRKQRGYVASIATTELRWRRDPHGWALRPTPWGTPDQRTLWRKHVWYHFPRYVRPGLYFLYRYVALGGFLDGWHGFVYHAVQGFWLRWEVDRELGRLERASRRS